MVCYGLGALGVWMVHQWLCGWFGSITWQMMIKMNPSLGWAICQCRGMSRPRTGGWRSQAAPPSPAPRRPSWWCSCPAPPSVLWGSRCPPCWPPPFLWRGCRKGHLVWSSHRHGRQSCPASPRTAPPCPSQWRPRCRPCPSSPGSSRTPRWSSPSNSPVLKNLK